MLGNITSIFILFKMVSTSFFDNLLLALTCIDTIFIIFSIVDYSLARGKYYCKYLIVEYPYNVSNYSDEV